MSGADARPREGLPPEASAKGGPWPRLPTAVAFLLALGVIWLGGQFLTQGVSDELTDENPELAVLVRGDSADAYSSLARAALLQQHYDAAIRLAARAVQLSPLNGPALATLGISLGHRGRRDWEDRVMNQGGELGWRDTLTQLWLFRRTVLEGDYDQSFRHADAAMREAWAVPDVMYLVLGAAVKDPPAIAPMAAQLALGPSWRQPFLRYIAQMAQPPETDEDFTLLKDLAPTLNPPQPEEVADLLDALIVEHRYADAMSDWRSLEHPAYERGTLVYNADFSQDPSKLPFDWTLMDGAGWSAHIGASPAGPGRALRVEYDGYHPPQTLGELLALQPGIYQLTGRWYDETGMGAQQMRWTVTCAPSRALIASARLQPGGPGAWRTFSAYFQVPAPSSDPAAACAGQWLGLWADGDGPGGQTAVWFDHLVVAPVEGATLVAGQSAGRRVSPVLPKDAGGQGAVSQQLARPMGTLGFPIATPGAAPR